MRMHELIKNALIFFHPICHFMCRFGCFKLTSVFFQKTRYFHLKSISRLSNQKSFEFFFLVGYVFLTDFSYLFGAIFTGGKIHP